MSFLKSPINLGGDNGFFAVELEYHSDQDFVLRLLEIKQKKGEMDFKIILNEKCEMDQLIKTVSGKSIILLITGKGVLTKKINQKTEDIQPEDVLPNSGKEDFYWQNYPQSNNSFATICRKQKVDDIHAIFKKNHCIVGETYLGIGVVTMTHLLIPQEEILLPKHHLLFQKDELMDIKSASNEEIIHVSGKKEIPSSLIPLLCASILFITKTDFISSIDSEEQQYFRNEWKQKNIFQKAGAVVLVAFLLILFGNYLAYQHYGQRYELLQEEVAYKQSEIDLLNTLNKELEEKQNLIYGTGLNNGYKVSVLADKIGITIPSTVLLTEMNLQPLEKGKLKKDEKASFENDRILLKGKIFKSTDINQWIKDIKNEKTVKEVVVTQYNQSLNENYAEFELTVNLN